MESWAANRNWSESDHIIRELLDSACGLASARLQSSARYVEINEPD
jgi:hypothetical protein